LRVITIVEEQSVTTGGDTQITLLLRHKWQGEIEKAVDKENDWCCCAKETEEGGPMVQAAWVSVDDERGGRGKSVSSESGRSTVERRFL